MRVLSLFVEESEVLLPMLAPRDAGDVLRVEQIYLGKRMNGKDLKGKFIGRSRLVTRGVRSISSGVVLRTNEFR